MSDDALGAAIGAAVADAIEHACSVAYGCSVDEFCTDSGSDLWADPAPDERLHPGR
jgi:hypothetical protein